MSTIQIVVLLIRTVFVMINGCSFLARLRSANFQVTSGEGLNYRIFSVHFYPSRIFGISVFRDSFFMGHFLSRCCTYFTYHTDATDPWSSPGGGVGA